MAVEDFGGSVLGHKIEMISADHQNKPDLGVAIARRWYEVENVDMITELTTSSVALAVHELSKNMKKIDIVVGAATSRLTGDACQPYGFHWAYDTHALAVGTGGSLVKAGGDTWFFMTADYAFGYALEKDTGDFVKANGGKVLGAGPHSPQLVGLLLLPAAGAELEGEDHRARQCRPRHHQLDQAGGRIRHRQERPEAGRPAADARRSARPRARRGAGAGADRGFTGTATTRAAISPTASSSAPGGCRT